MNEYSVVIVQYCPSCGGNNLRREVKVCEEKYIPIITCNFCEYKNEPKHFSHSHINDELELLEVKDNLRNIYLTKNNLKNIETKAENNIKKIIFFRDCAEYEKSIETNEVSKHYYSGKQAGLQMALNILKE